MNRDDIKVLIHASLIALCLIFAAAAAFADDSKSSQPYDCQAIRVFVAEHGKVRALALALENGASWRQIKDARKCLTR